MNKELKLHFRGDLGLEIFGETKEEEKLILNFLGGTGYPTEREYRLPCDDTIITVNVDFEVPEESQDIETLDDVKALFPHLVDDPIHEFFGLSYANYLVLQRSVMQSMPYKWQRTMVNLLNELDETIDWRRSGYVVQREDDDGNEILDDLADYQRGRRKVAKYD